jgi:hypothetical protein
MSSAPQPHLFEETDQSGEGCRWDDAIDGPVAEPGHLCVYLTQNGGAGGLPGFAFDDLNGEPNAKRYGAILRATVTQGGFSALGAWAATAP